MEVAQSRSGDHEVAITPTVTNTTDLTQVLSGLQSTGELSSVLQQQPHLVEGTNINIMFSILAKINIGGRHYGVLLLGIHVCI